MLHRDQGRKFAGYFKLPTLRHYLLLWPDKPEVIHHRRPKIGDTIETRILGGGEIVLDPPGITLSIEALYAP
jgi:hypothetical protein